MGANRSFQRAADQPPDHGAADTDAVPVSDPGSALLRVAAPRQRPGAPRGHEPATWQAMVVTFVIVLIASLLMLEARRTYVFTSQARDGAVAVPPM